MRPAAASAARTGRPLRFMATVVAGWAVLRAWLLWPGIGAVPALAHAGVAPPSAGAFRVMAPAVVYSATKPTAALSSTPPAGSLAGRPPSSARAGSVATALAGQAADAPPRPAPAPTEPAAGLSFGDPVPSPRAAAPLAADPAPGARLSGSGWLLLRGGPALAGGLAGAQLGGSQAGLRLAYAVDGGRRLAITGRVSSAIGGSGAGRREASLGVAWRPIRAPVTIVAEQRFGLDGGRGGPVVGVVAGLGPAPVAAGLRLETYGQAGAIARDGVEGFGDGAARLTRPLALGSVRLDVGAGAWGGIQRGARRLDVGPTLGGALPVAGHRLRLSLDWRARVAGDARPGSGPALSLGTDF